MQDEEEDEEADEDDEEGEEDDEDEPEPPKKKNATNAAKAAGGAKGGKATAAKGAYSSKPPPLSTAIARLDGRHAAVPVDRRWERPVITLRNQCGAGIDGQRLQAHPPRIHGSKHADGLSVRSVNMISQVQTGIFRSVGFRRNSKTTVDPCFMLRTGKSGSKTAAGKAAQSEGGKKGGKATAKKTEAAPKKGGATNGKSGGKDSSKMPGAKASGERPVVLSIFEHSILPASILLGFALCPTGFYTAAFGFEARPVMGPLFRGPKMCRWDLPPNRVRDVLSLSCSCTDG